jgi:hypothetical protein
MVAFDCMLCYDEVTIESKFLQGWVKYPTGGKQPCKPASAKAQIRLNSGADSKVWMKEEQDNPPHAGKGTLKDSHDWLYEP